jgi:hypothetical protein
MRMSFRFPLLVVTAVVFAVLLLAGAGWARKGHAGHVTVFGGAHIGPGCSTTSFCPGLPRDFSLSGHRRGNAGTSVGEIVYGRNGSGAPTQILVDVKCVAASGTHAVLGGVIRSSGAGFAIWVIDNGVPGSALSDQASYAQVDPLDSSIWPAGFPRACPAPDGDAFGAGFFDVVNGDVTVHS